MVNPHRGQPMEDISIEPLIASRARFLAFVEHRVNDRDLAEDILQDSLLKAIRSSPDVRDEARLTAWFFQLLRNAIIDSYRRRAVRQKHSEPLETVEIEFQIADEQRLCECFSALLPLLKPEYADLIAALDLGGIDPSALAERLGITPNNLKVRHHRARQALRRQIEAACRVCAEHHCLDCSCQASAPDSVSPTTA